SARDKAQSCPDCQGCRTTIASAGAAAFHCRAWEASRVPDDCGIYIGRLGTGVPRGRACWDLTKKETTAPAGDQLGVRRLRQRLVRTGFAQRIDDAVGSQRHLGKTHAEGRERVLDG